MYQHILIPTDGSELAERGVTHGLSLAKFVGAKVSGRQGRAKDCSTSSSNPMMEGHWCRFRREARAR